MCHCEPECIRGRGNLNLDCFVRCIPRNDRSRCPTLPKERFRSSVVGGAVDLLLKLNVVNSGDNPMKIRMILMLVVVFLFSFVAVAQQSASELPQPVKVVEPKPENVIYSGAFTADSNRLDDVLKSILGQSRERGTRTMGGSEVSKPFVQKSSGFIVDRTELWGTPNVYWVASEVVPAGTEIFVVTSTDMGLQLVNVFRFDYDFGTGYSLALMSGYLPVWIQGDILTFDVYVPKLNPSAKVSRTIYKWGGEMQGRANEIDSVTNSFGQTVIYSPMGAIYQNVSTIQIKGSFTANGQYEVMVDWFKVAPGAIVSVTADTITIDANQDQNLINAYTGRHPFTVKGPDGSCDTFIGKLKPSWR